MAKKKNFPIGPVLSIIAGIVVLIEPAILAWVIGLYLILNGVLRLR